MNLFNMLCFRNFTYVVCCGCRGTGGGRKGSQAQQQMVHGESPDGQQPVDKKQRREIANNNERRRMQCINNGFSTLQGILPKHFTKRGEKMSKVQLRKAY